MKKKKVVFEIGAHDGTDTEKWFKDHSNIIVYAFEPMPEFANKIRKRFKENSNVILTEAAIDIEETTKKFNIDKSRSSLYDFSDNLNQQFPIPKKTNWKFTESIEVKTIRLDSFIEKNNITAINYLWCDAQGNDFRVLQSLGNYINIVQEGRVEAAYKVTLYKGVDNSVDSITKWLSEHKFEFKIVPDIYNKEADIHFWKK